MINGYITRQIKEAHLIYKSNTPPPPPKYSREYANYIGAKQRAVPSAMVPSAMVPSAMVPSAMVPSAMVAFNPMRGFGKK